VAVLFGCPRRRRVTGGGPRAGAQGALSGRRRRRRRPSAAPGTLRLHTDEERAEPMCTSPHLPPPPLLHLMAFFGTRIQFRSAGLEQWIRVCAPSLIRNRQCGQGMPTQAAGRETHTHTHPHTPTHTPRPWAADSAPRGGAREPAARGRRVGAVIGGCGGWSGDATASGEGGQFDERVIPDTRQRTL